ncbi:MAG: hydrogenase 4 subunit B [Candidatus Levybacteria bacterium]|nr:hydrogenase 4 subunit B [Candidatus Levybacteria bacterium]
MLYVFILLLSIFFAGALGSLLLQKKENHAHLFAGVFAITGSLAGILFSFSLLFTQGKFSATIPTSFPLLKISLNIDSLSALFILIISTVALCSSIYGLSYMKHYYQKYNVGLFGFFYNLFILSMILVATANNGLYFLFVWELMSLASFFLVIFEHDRNETIRSGIIYFIMAHIGTAFILLAFLMLYISTGSFEFLAIKKASGSMPLLIKNVVFILMLLGFGTKAGIIPLHIWLPKAHSAAPSQVSSLMSGVMIKMGIFMMIRFFVDIFTQAPLWWGLTMLIIGAISSVLGVLYALSEHDIKRLLAYHSIENVGIILLGVGAGITFASLGLYSFGALAILAGLFHTINHAIFKSLLFFAAGSVINQTHTRNIEEYGGLIKLMPYTAVFFLIGSIAISGLPPFNGFVSEWLTFQALFAGIGSTVVIIKSVFIFAAVCLALTGGLAAACFVKAFGTAFLARPRSKEAEKAKESEFSLLSAMAILASLCLALGVLSSFFIPILTRVSQSLGNFSSKSTAISTNLISISVNNNFGLLNMQAVLGGLLLALILVFIVIYTFTGKQKIKFSETWACGFYSINPKAEITSTGFSRSLILIFRGIFQPTKQSTMDYVDADIRYFTKSKTITLTTANLYEKYIYYPAQRILFSLSRQVKKIQSGNINQYLLYIFITLIALLVWARFF